MIGPKLRGPAKALGPDLDRYLEEVHRHLTLDAHRPPCRDDDSLWLRWANTPFRCFLADREPPLFVVQAVVAENVEISTGLLEELNTISAQVVTARIFADEGWVVAQAEIVAATLTKADLEHLAWSVGSLASWAVPEICGNYDADVFVYPDAPQVRTALSDWT